MISISNVLKFAANVLVFLGIVFAHVIAPAKSTPEAGGVKTILLLVPGFFNSFAPEYFSQDIVQTFQDKGFQVKVIDSLNPVGSFEENGERLFQAMTYIEKDGDGRVEFEIIGHSAGGLYALFVANKKKFNIKHIFTVSTPFKGIDFLDEWISNSIAFKALTSLANLQSLRQFTPEKVKDFLTTIRISPKTKVMTFGGYQSAGIDIFDARQISVPLRVTGQLIPGASDGIVSYESALGAGVIKNSDNKLAIQENNKNIVLPLEHWEQVLDSDSFMFLGIRNTNVVRDEQIKFYSQLAVLLKR